MLAHLPNHRLHPWVCCSYCGEDHCSGKKCRSCVTCVAQSMASCCMSSDMSAFLITAFLSDMAFAPSEDVATGLKDVCHEWKKPGPLAFQLSVCIYMWHYSYVQIQSMHRQKF